MIYLQFHKDKLAFYFFYYKNLSDVADADLCLKYVLVERRCTGCKNKWSSLLENNKDLTELHYA